MSIKLMYVLNIQAHQEMVSVPSVVSVTSSNLINLYQKWKIDTQNSKSWVPKTVTGGWMSCGVCSMLFLMERSQTQHLAGESLSPTVERIPRGD